MIQADMLIAPSIPNWKHAYSLAWLAIKSPVPA
jgi:hypothetical protein